MGQTCSISTCCSKEELYTIKNSSRSIEIQSKKLNVSYKISEEEEKLDEQIQKKKSDTVLEMKSSQHSKVSIKQIEKNLTMQIKSSYLNPLVLKTIGIKERIKLSVQNMLIRQYNYKMVLCMKENGQMEREMDMESNNGQTDQFMKGNGKMIDHVEKENQFMQTEIYMMVIGQMMQQMVQELIFILMELNIKEKYLVNQMKKWLNDLQHGKGTETWSDGARYEGDYYYGKKNGKGKLNFADGSCYQGDFIDNYIEGFGNYIWPDGRSYVGQWIQNKMQGYGEIKWKDGRKYKGLYLDDKKNGKGIFYWEDGRKFIGTWLQGQQNGVGIYFQSDNSFRIGEWKDGKRIKWYNENEIHELQNQGILDDLKNQ
ncbi:unnamed protein product [Paramecium sonneborni]|uniref:MORN repeat protein n=1 Tax=Paramecium sonneborni TaxID=65129 RepID=A0A8S1K1J0_9CILI|nr:unnamed protein product [Paramecium sonneborni]